MKKRNEIKKKRTFTKTKIRNRSKGKGFKQGKSSFLKEWF